MSETKSRNLFAIAATAVATGVLAYVVYFDYKRRNDAQFRRKLRKEKKRVDKTVAQEKESTPSESSPSSDNITPEMLRAAMDQVKQEEVPVSTDEKEAYFMTQIGMGEQLAAQGPSFYIPAAISFFKALRVYPTPIELMFIYQKTVPEPLFKIIDDLRKLDEEVRVFEYYTKFPPKHMNVEIKPKENGRKVLLITKDIAAGETIYKEFPVIAVLDADLENAGKYCSHCFRPLDQEQASDLALRPSEENNPLGSTYCSQQCVKQARPSSILLSQEPILPPEFASSSSPALDIEARRTARDNFVAYLKKEQRSAPLLVMRFIARQIAAEIVKLASKVSPSVSAGIANQEDFTDADGGDYTLADHIERLRLVEVKPNDEELSLLSAVTQKSLPGLEQFVTDERHSILLGKMIYNAIGVGSRDDKPEPTARPEDIERSRTHLGSQRQLGSAIYTLSSYVNHSCSPSGKYTFPNGTTELHVVATHNLKKGDEVTVAYVDTNQHDSESVLDARRRRRIELARGWKFACGCERCEQEGKELSEEEKLKSVVVAGVEEGNDLSKVEESARIAEEKAQMRDGDAERAAEVE